MSTDIGSRLVRLERQLAAAIRAPKFANASIENTTIEVYDETGSLRALVGQQPDGTSGVTAVNGPPPPAPALPQLTPVLGAISVGWDGTFPTAQAAPLDFARIEVHASPAAAFEPGPCTLRGSLESPQGGTLTIPTDTPLYVRLVARNTSGTASAPSPVAGPVAPAPVDQSVLDSALSDATSQRFTDTMRDASTWHAANTAPGTSWTIRTPVPDAPQGPDVLEASGTVQLYSTTQIAIDPDTLYRISVRIRATSQAPEGPTEVYAGLMGYAADATTLVNCTGEPSPFNQHYAAAYGKTLPASDGWKVYTGYVRGRAAAGAAAPRGSFPDPRTPAVLHGDVRFARPMFWLNYGRSTASMMQIDTMTVEAVRTGVVGAGNLTTGAVTTPAIANGAVTVDKLRVGATGNLCLDPSFEIGHVTRLITQLQIPWASVEAGGNRSPNALRIDTAAGGASRTWSYDPFPMNPGEQFWLATDVKYSPDWAGTGVAIALAWQGADGKTISRSSIPAPTVPGSAWRRISGSVRAPANTVRAALQLEATGGTAGAVWFDNVECRAVLSSATTGERAELSPDGVRLFDQDGEQVVSLVTGEPNYLTLSSQGRAVASISEEGRAGFQSLAVAEDLTWRGDSLSTHLDRLPRGIQAINTQLTANVTSAMGIEMGWVELACTIDTTRMYRIVVDTYTDPSLDGGEVVLFLRDGGTGEPTLQSRQLHSHVTPIKGEGWHRAHLELTCPGTYLGDGTHRLLSSFLCRWAPAGQTVRLFGSDGYPSVMYVEDIGPALPSTGGLNPAGASQPLPKPLPTRYTKTYAAAWSGSYANRGSYNSYYGSQLVQGYYSSTNGTQAALVGFPTALANDLAGAKIESVQLYLYFEHWYATSGGRAVIKAHGHSSRPTSFSSDGASMSVSWGRNEGKWIDISSIFDETRWRGIALDPGSSSSTYYGRARGVGQSNPPQLKVTYTK
ncbi:hypothetical protein ACGFRG_05710 [Streptomyces sp. NPDC048696]|uniref:hypothetical protein n=1 Tax=Streptomyces sp. NPDC048696 TaxID=3365585 RepID=UPI003720C4BE